MMIELENLAARAAHAGLAAVSNADAGRRRLGLSGAAVAWLVLAVSVVAGCVLAFGKIGEDVVAGNGWQTSDLGEVESVADHRSAALVSAAALLARAGSVPVLAAVCVLVGALLWWRGERLVVALAPLAALAVTGALAAVGKQIVGRARPPAPLRLIAETEASFPSGHSADSAAVLITIGVIAAALIAHRLLVRVAWIAAAFCGAVMVGASRVELGVHYPTDVAAGWALGIAVAVIAASIALIARRMPRKPARSGRSILAPVLRALTWSRTGNPPTLQAAA